MSTVIVDTDAIALADQIILEHDLISHKQPIPTLRPDLRLAVGSAIRENRDALVSIIERYWKEGCTCGDQIIMCQLCRDAEPILRAAGRLAELTDETRALLKKEFRGAR